MKTKYLDTAFGNLIWSYMYLTDGLTEEEVEQALREHAKKSSGCISCRYSKALDELRGNIWTTRTCQLGLSQNDCRMFKEFPE